MKRKTTLILTLFACIFFSIPNIAQTPSCVHVNGVDVSINQAQNQVEFLNKTDKSVTINWEVWSNDPNYNPKKIASGTVTVPAKKPSEGGGTWDGKATRPFTIPQGWSGAWLEHCKN